MVASYIQEMVDRFMRDGADTDPQGLEWRKQWLSGDHKESAYDQMYGHAVRYYGDLEQKQRRQEAEAARSQQLAFQQQMQLQQQQYQGMLSMLSNAYASQAGHANQDFYNQMANIQARYTSQLGQINLQNLQAEIDAQKQITQAVKPTTQKYNFNAQQMGNDEIGNFYKQFENAQQGFNQGYGLLSKFAPEQAQALSQRYNELQSQFVPGLESTALKQNTLFQNFGGERELTASDYASQMQQYQAGLQEANQGRQNLTGLLSQLGMLGLEAQTRGTALEGEARQRNLTNRSQYYANQQSRESQRVASQAEQRGAMSVARNRERLSRSASSGTLSRMLR